MKRPEWNDPGKLPMRDLMQRVADEIGITPSMLTQGLLRERQRIHNLVANDMGKFRVLRVDTYDHEDWVDGEFDSPEDAISYVKEKTAHAKAHPNASGSKLDHSTGKWVRFTESTSRFYA